MKTTNRNNHWYAILLLMMLLAAGLRLFHLNESPLRGDEAFTVRYWAAPLADVLSLARTEPHPFGAFFAFGLWKTWAGDSEFAMRFLPALLNLIGIPAIAGLAWRLFHRRDTAYIAALLWALNPFLIWHSQDVRNYAIWAALSVLAFYTLVRAAKFNQRGDWLGYTLCAAVALYFFYFEAFFTLFGGLYILLWRRERLKQWFVAMLALSVLLIPWLIQAYALATSGYKGSAGGVILSDLWQLWLPTLFIGETLPGWFSGWVVCLLLVIGGWVAQRRYAPLLIGYLLLPIVLITLVSTRMNVFLPRYIIAVLPALLLPLAAFSAVIWRSRLGKPILIASLLLYAGIPLQSYWSGDYHKAPDWYALRDYLHTHTKPGDLIILNTSDPAAGTLDPAFGYYYHPEDRTIAVLPGASSEATNKLLQAWSISSASIWSIPSGVYAREVDQALRQHFSTISDRGVGRSWIVREFRPLLVWQGEADHALTAETMGAKLKGFSIDQTESELTVLLYWEKLPTFTVSVQLIGAPNPANNGSPLWSQADHPPTAPRDVHTLLLPKLPPGVYQLQVVAYDPATPATRFVWNTGIDNLNLTEIHPVLTPNR